jgi:hypothetical protein
MSFDEGMDIAIVFILQTNTESVQHEKRGSFGIRKLIFDISTQVLR